MLGRHLLWWLRPCQVGDRLVWHWQCLFLYPEDLNVSIIWFRIKFRANTFANANCVCTCISSDSVYFKFTLALFNKGVTVVSWFARETLYQEVWVWALFQSCYSHNASVYPGVYICTGELWDKLNGIRIMGWGVTYDGYTSHPGWVVAVLLVG